MSEASDTNSFKYYVVGLIGALFFICGVATTCVMFSGLTITPDMASDNFKVMFLVLISIFFATLDFFLVCTARHAVGCVNPKDFKE